MGYTPHVLVVGGGPVGAGLARDFAIRGLDVTLVDSGPIASERRGRMERLLSSGAAVAREDPRYARRCLTETRTLSQIATHCTDGGDGLLVCPDADARLEACEQVGISATRLSATELDEREPSLELEDDESALEVPDTVVDPNLLTVALVRDAHEYDADIRPRTELLDITVEDGTVQSVTLGQNPPWFDDSRLEPDGDSAATSGDEAGGKTGEAGNDGDGGDDSVDEDDVGEPVDEAVDDDSTDGASGSDAPDGARTEHSDDARTDGSGLDVIAGYTDQERPGVPGGGRTDVRPVATRERLEVDYIVNAAGTDAANVAALADCPVPVSRERVPVLTASDCSLETPLSRPTDGHPATAVPDTGIVTLTPGSDSDSAVTEDGGRHPDGGAASVGDDSAGPPDGTADAVPVPAPEAVDTALEELSGLLSEQSMGRVVRAETTVRYESGSEGRDFAAVDHGKHHDCWGLLTVVGGTVTTHRWVAEKVCDRVCQEFGILRECQTDELLLPGSEEIPELATALGTFGLEEQAYERGKRRLGSAVNAVLATDEPNPVVCPGRSVTREEIAAAVADETTVDADLGGVRVRTGAATGGTQGGRCAVALSFTLPPTYQPSVAQAARYSLLAERWRGQRPLSGPQVTEMARTYRRYADEGRLPHRPLESDPDCPPLEEFAGASGDRETPRPYCCPRVGWEP